MSEPSLSSNGPDIAFWYILKEKLPNVAFARVVFDFALEQASATPGGFAELFRDADEAALNLALLPGARDLVEQSVPRFNGVVRDAFVSSEDWAVQFHAPSLIISSVRAPVASAILDNDEEPDARRLTPDTGVPTPDASAPTPDAGVPLPTQARQSQCAGVPLPAQARQSQPVAANDINTTVLPPMMQGYIWQRQCIQQARADASRDQGHDGNQQRRQRGRPPGSRIEREIKQEAAQEAQRERQPQPAIRSHARVPLVPARHGDGTNEEWKQDAPLVRSILRDDATPVKSLARASGTDSDYKVKKSLHVRSNVIFDSFGQEFLALLTSVAVDVREKRLRGLVFARTRMYDESPQDVTVRVVHGGLDRASRHKHAKGLARFVGWGMLLQYIGPDRRPLDGPSSRSLRPGQYIRIVCANMPTKLSCLHRQTARTLFHQNRDLLYS